MAYRFEIDDASVQDGVRRIALDQLDKAVGEGGDGALGVDRKVHQLRKRCKKLRGLIRLVRPVFADYAKENAEFRNLAAELSLLRDADVLIGTYDSLVRHCDDRIERREIACVRRRLTDRKNALSGARDVEGKLSVLADRLAEARDRACRWRLSADGFAAIADGLAKTYRRAGKAMAKACRDRKPEAFHEWRKRTKYHGYHARLLAPAWPGPLEAHCEAADRLNDVLGEHHDLAVFEQTVARDPKAFGGLAAVDILCGLVERRQAALEAEAFLIGGRVLAEPAKALRRRWEAYWRVWREEQQVREAALAA